MDYPTIIQIDDILVSSEIITEFFACDYPVCKGCCCIIGDSGAPLLDSEPERIEKIYPQFSGLMRPQGRAAVEAKGFFEIDIDGDVVTPLVPGTEECAYCHFDEAGNCLCAMERLWFSRRSNPAASASGDAAEDFRKPISCWLYPIRVSVLRNGLTALNLHRWDICKDAFAKGRRDNVRVYQFLREPLVAAFGEDFYEALCAAASELIP